jgi:hypothetical protein
MPIAPPCCGCPPPAAAAPALGVRVAPLLAALGDLLGEPALLHLLLGPGLELRLVRASSAIVFCSFFQLYPRSPSTVVPESCWLIMSWAAIICFSRLSAMVTRFSFASRSPRT